METQRPLVNIAGDIYQVDIIGGILDLQDDHSTGKSLLLANMYLHGDRYRFLYDKRDKTIYTITPDTWRLPDDVVMADLCGKSMLDPATYARRKGQEPEIFGPYFLELAQTERTALIMPKYDIGGHQFFVIPYERVFIDTTDLSNRLSFSSFRREGNGRPLLQYNTITRKAAGRSLKEDSNAVVIIELPSHETLQQLEQESEKYRGQAKITPLHFQKQREVPPPGGTYPLRK
jgi:hypothetical protein